MRVVGCVTQSLALSTCKRKVVGSNSAWFEKIFRPLTPSSYSTFPGLSRKWTGRLLVTDNGTKCAWGIHKCKALQTHALNAFVAASMCVGCLVALKSAEQPRM